MSAIKKGLFAPPESRPSKAKISDAEADKLVKALTNEDADDDDMMVENALLIELKKMLQQEAKLRTVLGMYLKYQEIDWVHSPANMRLDELVEACSVFCDAELGKKNRPKKRDEEDEDDD